MLPFLLLLTGGAVSIYCLWLLKRWLGEPREAGPEGRQRLEALVDELVATAEATSLIVQEKSERLAELIAEADQRVGALAGAGAPAPVAVEPVAEVRPAPAVPEPVAARAAVATAAAASPVPEAHRRVYALADEGQDVTAIARQMGLTKGEVLLILGLRK